MNKKIMMLTASAVILGGLAATPNLIKAYQGDPNVKGPDCTPERHEAMTQAFNNNDYNAWKELMQGRGRVSEIINEGNFARFSEMHKLMLEGNVDEANKIRVELGLGSRNGSGREAQRGFGMGRNR